tara:strand:+ start:2643 stop:3704 length:1062 start_codon:yes stop_codon:yes gene_type:complete
MQVVLFRNVIGENTMSMERYTNELLKFMPDGVSDFTIKAKNLPLLRHYLHKEYLFPKIASRHQGQLNHISDHSYAGLLKYLDPKITILTCHDLIPLDIPKETSFLGRLRHNYNLKFLPRAERIITSSNTTKKSIKNHFNYPEDKISIIPYGVSSNFRTLNNRSQLKEKYSIKNKSILHVGTSFPRKNIELILKLLLKNKEITFIKIGKFTAKQKKYIIKHGLKKRIFNISEPAISSKELIEIYNIADVLLMPSLAEGFGLPILEAMACGCPVVCSDIAVFKELYNDQEVCFINPGDLEEFDCKLSNILENDSYRDKLIKNGFAKSKQFSWQSCAEKTYQIYKEVFYGRNKKFN